jgi:hypothetical protein
MMNTQENFSMALIPCSPTANIAEPKTTTVTKPVAYTLPICRNFFENLARKSLHHTSLDQRLGTDAPLP